MSAVEDPSGHTAASLVTGIVGDLQQLVEQQFQLTRQEIEVELRLRTAAATMVVIGMAVLFIDAIVACQALALLLHWAASPPGTDPAWLSLWSCYALVAGVLVVIGVIVTVVGCARFKSIKKFGNPVSEIL